MSREVRDEWQEGEGEAPAAQDGEGEGGLGLEWGRGRRYRNEVGKWADEMGRAELMGRDVCGDPGAALCRAF
jgi:hypothetical protein